ncbi:MAG TPA: hypothetical protein VH852_07515 [Hyphomicrobium sp.]|jgi:hypothetical protein
MTKTRLALISALLAATAMLASTAEAGMKVRLQFGYPLGTFTAHGNSGGSYSEHRKTRRHYARRNAKEDVKVTKKFNAAKTVARAEPEAKTEKVEEPAKTENSSISTATIAPAEATPATEPVKTEAKPEDGNSSATKLGCKQFFPSVGMTLSVPCEQGGPEK